MVKHRPINWLHLHPRVVFVASVNVLFALLCIWGVIKAFSNPDRHGLHARGGAGACILMPFIFFYFAYLTLKKNKVSNYDMVLALTGFGTAASFALVVYMTNVWMIIGLAIPYFLYVINAFRILYMEKTLTQDRDGIFYFCFLALINLVAIGLIVWRCTLYPAFS